MFALFRRRQTAPPAAPAPAPAPDGADSQLPPDLEPDLLAAFSGPEDQRSPLAVLVAELPACDSTSLLAEARKLLALVGTPG